MRYGTSTDKIEWLLNNVSEHRRDSHHNIGNNSAKREREPTGGGGGELVDVGKGELVSDVDFAVKEI